MKSTILTLLAVFVLSQLFSQTKYNNYNVYTDTVTTDTRAWIPKSNVMIYLPSDYKTKSYPIFWFFNGMGEDGGGVQALAVNGPFNFINKGWQPGNFIVIAVQNIERSDDAIDLAFYNLRSRYNLTGSIIASGLSDGGFGVTRTAARATTTPFVKQLVAIVPMSTSQGYGSAAVNPVIANKIAVWGLGADPSDVHGVNTHNFINALLKANPTGPYTWTNMQVIGHCCWNNYYNPSFTQNGLNIYNWGLKYASDTVITTPPPTITYSLIAQIYDEKGQLVYIYKSSEGELIATYTKN